MLKKEYGFLLRPFLLSMTGILFSIWNVLDKEAFICLTEGCSLFAEYSINGISLWWLGVFGFSLLLLLAILGMQWLGWLVAGIGLILDIFLLFIMMFTLPCFNCLIIGLLLAFTYLSFRKTPEGRRIVPKISILFSIWILFFIINIGSIMGEMQKPWAIIEPKIGTASIHIYFSPSCSACRSLVAAQSSGANGAQASIAWYPVSENKDDAWRIGIIQKKLALGENLNLAVLMANSAESSDWNALAPSSLLLQFRLWRNAAHVYTAGSNVLPFVEYHGVPASLLHQNTGENISGENISAFTLQLNTQNNSNISNAADTLNVPIAPMDLMGIAGSCGKAEDPC